MKLRFQIGLEQAVREPEREDVLPAGSFPEEVVDAEDLALSSNTSCSFGVSATTALVRSVPNGFSITMREAFPPAPASASMRTAGSAALGGTLR